MCEKETERARERQTGRQTGRHTQTDREGERVRSMECVTMACTQIDLNPVQRKLYLTVHFHEKGFSTSSSLILGLIVSLDKAI